MLRGLGIGVYDPDGQAIRPGDERSAADPWLYEDEVHALIAMAAAEDRRNLVSFTDWHGGLRELGLEMSAAELATVYDEAYFAEYRETFFVELVSASGLYIDHDYLPQTYMTRLQAWLLLLDGFVVRDDSLARLPLAHAGPAWMAAQHTEKWGGASSQLPRLLSDADLPVDLAAAAARLETLARSVSLTLGPNRQQAHEGHGGEGGAVTFTVSFAPYQRELLTPFGDAFYLVPQPQPEGLPVRWEVATSKVLKEHGTPRDHTGADLIGDGFGAPRTTPTRSDGSAELTFTPRREEAEGEGQVVTDVVIVNAVVDVHEVARRTWQVPQALLAWMQQSGGTMTAAAGDGPAGSGATLEIEWHEVRGLRIEMVDDYDVQFEFPKFRGAEESILAVRRVGTDRISGFLALQEDGTYRGLMRGTTNSQWQEDGMGGSCSTTLAGAQDLLVVAELREEGRPGDAGFPIALRFYPIAPPEIDQLGCDWELDFWWGVEPDDPEFDAAESVPSQFFAPFNDRRIKYPHETSFVTAMPESGTRTYVYEEFAPGLGGGTWTVIVEVVEPER